MLTSAQTRMYLFFCKCADSSSRWFWNSYNDICAALNLKRSAVIQTVKELCSIGLIKKRSIKKKDGSRSDNHYKVITIKLPRIKKRNGKGRSYFALSFPQLSIFIKTLSNNIIKHEIIKVNINHNYFFNCRGSPKICSSLYSTHLYLSREEKRKYLYLKYRCNLGWHFFDKQTRLCFSSLHINSYGRSLLKATHTACPSPAAWLEEHFCFFPPCQEFFLETNLVLFVRTMKRTRSFSFQNR